MNKSSLIIAQIDKRTDYGYYIALRLVELGTISQAIYYIR